MPNSFCQCECGQEIPATDNRGRPRKFIMGHQNYGKHWSIEERRKVSERMRGANNWNWNPDRKMVGRLGQGFSKSQRKKLLGKFCIECGTEYNLILDHKLPIFAGGTNDDSNAQTLCASCNQIKRTWEISFYGKLGEFRKRPNPNWMGNSEPNEDGNILVGATASGRVYKRPATKLLAIECFCDQCNERYLVSAWRLRGYRTRPAPKKHFCSDSCRLLFLNHNRKTVIATKSARPERDDIAWTNGKPLEAVIKNSAITWHASHMETVRRHDHDYRPGD